MAGKQPEDTIRPENNFYLACTYIYRNQYFRAGTSLKNNQTLQGYEQGVVVLCPEGYGII